MSIQVLCSVDGRKATAPTTYYTHTHTHTHTHDLSPPVTALNAVLHNNLGGLGDKGNPVSSNSTGLVTSIKYASMTLLLVQCPGVSRRKVLSVKILYYVDKTASTTRATVACRPLCLQTFWTIEIISFRPCGYSISALLRTNICT